MAILSDKLLHFEDCNTIPTYFPLSVIHNLDMQNSNGF